MYGADSERERECMELIVRESPLSPEIGQEISQPEVQVWGGQ